MDHIQLTGVLLFVTVLWHAAAFARMGALHSVRPTNWSPRLLILVAATLFWFWLTAGAMYLVHRTSLLRATSFIVGQAGAARGSGLVVFLIGNLLLDWSRRSLGKNLQAAGTPPGAQNTLVTLGPYRTIRHPLYLSELALSLGLGLITGSWVFPALGLILLLLLPSVIATEEAALSRAFGEPWSDYARRTKRMIPGIW